MLSLPPRQQIQPPNLVTAAVTLSNSPSPPGASIGVDTQHTSSVSGLALQTFTVTSSPTASSSSPSPTSSAPPPNIDRAASKAFSTGAIVGVAVGVFGLLALVLIVVMTLQHRRRMRGRRNSGRNPSRRSWTRIDQPAELQMRATNPDGGGHAGDESFLSFNSKRGRPEEVDPRIPPHAQPPSRQQHQDLSHTPQLPPYVLSTEEVDPHIPSYAQPPSRQQNQDLSHTPQLPPLVLSTEEVDPRIPFHAQPPSRQQHQDLSRTPQLPPLVLSTEEAQIPNPFSSPPRSPNHTPSHSHSSTYSSANVPPPSMLHTAGQPRFSSVSDYPYSLTDPEPVSRFSTEPTESNLQVLPKRRPSPNAQDGQSRARELRAMQDLISALDRSGPAPASFLTIDTAGGSRLSRGEGLVTPGGHSPKDGEIKLEGGGEYWTSD